MSEVARSKEGAACKAEGSCDSEDIGRLLTRLTQDSCQFSQPAPLPVPLSIWAHWASFKVSILILPKSTLLIVGFAAGVSHADDMEKAGGGPVAPNEPVVVFGYVCPDRLPKSGIRVASVLVGDMCTGCTLSKEEVALCAAFCFFPGDGLSTPGME